MEALWGCRNMQAALMVLYLDVRNAFGGNLSEKVCSFLFWFTDTVVTFFQSPSRRWRTDEWSSHCRLSSVGYIHYVVNHSDDFVNLVDGTHTNFIKSLWSHLKRRIREVNGSRKTMIYSYLEEFLYRKWFGMKISASFRNWDVFIQHVQELYPV